MPDFITMLLNPNVEYNPEDFGNLQSSGIPNVYSQTFLREEDVLAAGANIEYVGIL